MQAEQTVFKAAPPVRFAPVERRARSKPFARARAVHRSAAGTFRKAALRAAPSASALPMAARFRRFAAAVKRAACFVKIAFAAVATEDLIAVAAAVQCHPYRSFRF